MESKTHKENVLNKKERDSTLVNRDKRRARTNVITAANEIGAFHGWEIK